TCTHSITGGNINLALSNGKATAPAVVWLGFRSAEVTLPGWCGPLYLSPLATVAGTTNATGGWASGSGPSSLLNIAPYAEIYTQYAFLDASLPVGIGLSDRGVVCAPAHGSQYIRRVWSLSASSGHENATSGSMDASFGLIVHFGIF